MFWEIFLLLIFSLLYYKLCHQPLQYWKRKKVKQERWPTPIFGDFFPALARIDTFAGLINKIYTECKERYCGIYQLQYPVFFVKDLDLIKRITVKDFDYFMDHRSFLPGTTEPLIGKNLFALKGDRWRDLRSTLSPTFTISKMRLMFSLMNECAEQFTKFFLENNKGEITLEMKDTFSRYANDVIATCAFGTQIDSLKERDNEFYLLSKDSVDFTTIWKNMKLLMIFLSPKIAKLATIHLMSDKVAIFFTNLIKNSVKEREEQKIVRADMINLLMEARNGRLVHEYERKTQKTEITDNDITDHAFIFIFAGFETATTLMSFMSHELAINPDIQEKLIAEIDETRRVCKGKITYEDLTKLKFMDMVISETLRKYPPALAIDRVCTRPYTIEPITPEEQLVQLTRGDLIWIPITALHYDPQYFPNPDKFDPERFNDENKYNIKPFTYLPFGVGPRNCIGSRFALLETKVIYYNILSHFKITVVEKTEVPIEIAKAQLNVNAKNGYWVGLKRRTDEECNNS